VTSGGELINFNSRSYAVAQRNCGYDSRKGKKTKLGMDADVFAHILLTLVTFRARSFRLLRIVNRNLIGRFTVFAGTVSRRSCVFIPHARNPGGAVFTQNTNVVYAAAYLAGRLSTVKHRSPSLLSHFLPCTPRGR